jgi:hypothetical protein
MIMPSTLESSEPFGYGRTFMRNGYMTLWRLPLPILPAGLNFG